MSEAYTVFWTQDRCKALRKLGGVGKPLELVFGGPHTSEPSFQRASVRPDDELYPISVHAGVLYVLGRVRVRRILSLEEYVAAYPALFAPYVQEPPAWAYRQDGSGLTPGYVQALEAFNRYRGARPEVRVLAPTCTEEAVECADGTPMRLDLPVPSDMLVRLRYRSRRKERDLQKYLRDGRMVQSLGVQGIYRLSEASAEELSALVDGAAVAASH
jgi:hypothetical protein